MGLIERIIEALVDTFFWEIVEWVKTSSIGRVVFWSLLLIGLIAGAWAMGRAMGWW